MLNKNNRIDTMNNTNTCIILGTFIQRIDDLYNEKNTIHLQASVAAIRGDLD